MSFALCHKVKFIEATKHFQSHSFPADPAVSDPELPMRRETKTRTQTEATRSSHGTRDTPAAEKCKLELELEDAVEEGFELRKGIGLRFQRAQAPNTAKHAKYKALKGHQQKAQFRRDWANRELRNLKQRKHHCQSYQDVDSKLGEYVCFAAMVGEVRLLLRLQGRDPTRKCLRWKARRDGRFMGVMECHDQRKRILLIATGARNVFAENWALYSAESQECEFVDEEAADDRRPQRDAQQTLENAVRFKNKTTKAKATYRQCLSQHTRVLHVRVAVVHGPHVCVCRFWLDPKPGQRPHSLQRSKETAKGQLARPIC